MNRGDLAAWPGEKESMMGDRNKAIKQKWEIGWITTGVVSSPRMGNIMNDDGYKLKALHQKKLRGAAMLQSGNKINTSLSATGIWQNSFFLG